MKLHRALSAVLRADRRELTAAGLADELDERCRAMLSPELSRAVRDEVRTMARSATIEAPPARMLPPVTRPSFLRPRVPQAVPAPHVIGRHVPHFMRSSVVAAPAVD